MSSKKDETWVLATAMEQWAQHVRQMQERISELADQLEQMERITVTRSSAAPLAAGPKDDPEQPAPLTRKKIGAAAAYWAQSCAMPPWLPVCSREDAAKIVDAGRKRVARAKAKADPQMAERAKAVAQEAKEADAALEGERWPAPPAPTPEEKKRRIRTGLKRVSFRMLYDELAKENGPEVVDYAVKHMCGSQRTANALREAMKTFLGVHPSDVDAGIAFGQAQGRPVAGVPEETCREYLTLARHKVRLDDGSWAVWSQHVAPGDVGPAS